MPRCEVFVPADEFAQLLGRIQSEFRLLIWKTPETIMPGRMTTRGRIEYQFEVCGALTILFIEVM